MYFYEKSVDFLLLFKILVIILIKKLVYYKLKFNTIIIFPKA